MIFNKHSALEGQHAFLGASKYHWINYDESKVAESYSKFLAMPLENVRHRPWLILLWLLKRKTTQT